MPSIWKHTTTFGKAIILIFLVAGICAAIYVAYGLLGPTPIGDVTD